MVKNKGFVVLVIALFFMFMLTNRKVNAADNTNIDNNFYENEYMNNENMQLGVGENYITVSGTITWKTYWESAINEARNVKVDVWDMCNSEQSTLLASGYSNDVGEYSFTFPNDNSASENGYDIMVKITARNEYANVINNNLMTYTVTNPDISVDVQNGSTIIKDIFIACSCDEEKAFVILQAVTMAGEYTKVMNGSALPRVDMIYPTNENGTSYSSLDNMINILFEDYDHWDAIQHEYGHYVRDMVTDISSAGGGHAIFWNLIDNNFFNDADEDEVKGLALNLAWSEGWASYFSKACQQYFNASLLDISFVGSEILKYSSSESYYNLETGVYTVMNDNSVLKLGEANEAAIMSILFDFLDGTTESYDYVQYTHQQIWNKAMNNSVTTLSDFLAQFNTESYEQLIKIGYILSKFGVSSTSLQTPDVFTVYCPTLSWTAGGGSVKAPNNSFRLRFFTPSKEQILVTSPITTTSYKLTQSEWTTLLSNPSEYLFWIVEASQSDTPTTGPYYSAPSIIHKPTATSINSAEPVINTLTTREFHWYKFTSPLTGTYTFETTGTTDTVGELFPGMVWGDSVTGRFPNCYSNNISTTNQNFRLTYTIEEGVSVYLRVRGYNLTATGTYTLKVTPPVHVHYFTYSYTSIDNAQHYAYCYCGASTIEMHDYFNERAGYRCSDCGHYTTGPVIIGPMMMQNQIPFLPLEDEKKNLV